jgi:hypothetical protein
MTGTNCDLFTHKQSRSYLNHLVYETLCGNLTLSVSCLGEARHHRRLKNRKKLNILWQNLLFGLNSLKILSTPTNLVDWNLIKINTFCRKVAWFGKNSFTSIQFEDQGTYSLEPSEIAHALAEIFLSVCNYSCTANVPSVCLSSASVRSNIVFESDTSKDSKYLRILLKCVGLYSIPCFMTKFSSAILVLILNIFQHLFIEAALSNLRKASENSPCCQQDSIVSVSN